MMQLHCKACMHVMVITVTMMTVNEMHVCNSAHSVPRTCAGIIIIIIIIMLRFKL